jgi:hypothetical protein
MIFPVYFFLSSVSSPMSNATLLLIFGSLTVLTLAGVVYLVLMTTYNSPINARSLDLAEDHQRIDTKDPSAARFSDKIVIDSSFP